MTVRRLESIYRMRRFFFYFVMNNSTLLNVPSAKYRTAGNCHGVLIFMVDLAVMTHENE